MHLPKHTNNIIEVENVSLKYDNKLALNNINLEISNGEFLIITGPNGGGKTSLLRIILGLMKPSAGKIQYFNNGELVPNLHIGYLPQKNMIDSRFPVTVSEVVATGLLSRKSMWHKLTTKQNDEIYAMLQTVGMDKYAQQPIGSLSGGQLQRTLLGRALISNPQVLVLDEPLSYVDHKFEQRMTDIISHLIGNTTIIMVTHSLNQITENASQIITLNTEITDY